MWALNSCGLRTQASAMAPCRPTCLLKSGYRGGLSRPRSAQSEAVHASLDTPAHLETSRQACVWGRGSLTAHSAAKAPCWASPPADLEEALQVGMHLLKHLRF